MQLDNVLASVILDDFFTVGESALKSAPEVVKLCTDFGIPSMDHVAIDCWPSEDLKTSCDLFRAPDLPGPWEALVCFPSSQPCRLSDAAPDATCTLVAPTGKMHSVFLPWCGSPLKAFVHAVHPVQSDDIADSTRRRIMGLMYYR